MRTKKLSTNEKVGQKSCPGEETWKIQGLHEKFKDLSRVSRAIFKFKGLSGRVSPPQVRQAHIVSRVSYKPCHSLRP